MHILTGLFLLGLSASGAQSESDGASAARLDILPMLDVFRCSKSDDRDSRCEEANPTPQQQSPQQQQRPGANRAESNAYIGSYTRFVIEEVPMGGEADRGRYDREARRAIDRFMSARSLTRVLSIRTVLSRPAVSTTTTLMSANQESNSRQGESWTTEQNERLYLTPYFRVSPTSASTVEVSLNASSAIQGEITGTVIGMLMQGSKLVAPSSTLITSASEARLIQASDYLSNTVSRLFAQNLSEKRSIQFGPSEWADQTVVIEARLPSHRRISSEDVPVVGRWRVSAEPAVVSIFNPLPYCDKGDCSGASTEKQAKKGFENLSPLTVLNFDLDGAQTVVQAIRSDPAVARALDGLARVPPETNLEADAQAAPAGAAQSRETQDARAEESGGPTEGEPSQKELSPARRAAVNVLCNVVAAKAESLGFNRFDVAAIVWAVAHSDVILNDDGSALLEEGACTHSTLARSLGLPTRPKINRPTSLKVAKGNQAPSPGAGATTPAPSQPGGG